jgi:hypothetical protein
MTGNGFLVTGIKSSGTVDSLLNKAGKFFNRAAFIMKQMGVLEKYDS